MSNHNQTSKSPGTTTAESLQADSLEGVAGGVRQPDLRKEFATIEIKSDTEPQQLQDIIAIL